MNRLSLPAGLSADAFLARHWQKAPLFLPQALPPGLPALAPDEIAWLATQEDVESRLVVTHGTRYDVSHGPFADDELRRLPPRDWTLLVQDVEKHLPDFRAWLDAVPFVPDWRIDDLMVSCAAPGGSAGPHRDHYDVFLCQGDGVREWRLTSDATCMHDDRDSGFALLQPFDDPHPLQAATGDVLYLPPGIGHWGIARRLAVTYSIGMRAPTRRDFVSGSARRPEDAGANYYRDGDLQAKEARPGRISAAALARARECFGLDGTWSDDDVARAFVSVATSLKAWLVPEPPDARIAGAGTPLAVHGMARLAWSDNGWAGVNGHARRLQGKNMRSFRALCGNRQVDSTQRMDPALRDWMIECAALTVADDAPQAARAPRGTP